MGRIARTIDDLNNELVTQLDFLLKSCYAFDEGDYIEAKRISSILRILLKDKGSSISLLGQLNRKVEFYSYAYKVDGDISLQQNYLVCILGNAVHEYLPNFISEGIKKELLPFNDWWTQIVISDEINNEFTRENIILSMAEQDGGSHVDPSINDDYFKLTRENSQMAFYAIGDFSQGFPDVFPKEALKSRIPPVWHTIRQIAHEVLITMGKEYFYDPRPYYEGMSIAGVSFYIKK